MPNALDWRYFARLALSCAILFEFGEAARAEIGSQGFEANCRFRVAEADLLAVAANPRRILLEPEMDDARLAWRARVIASAGRGGLLALRAAIPWARESQKIAIGEGLARAAAACRDRDGAVAAEIADMLRGAGDAEVDRAFKRYLLSVSASGPRASAEPRSQTRARGLPWRALGDAEHDFEPTVGAMPGTPEP